MTRRRNALLAGPLLVFLASLLMSSPSIASAAAAPADEDVAVPTTTRGAHDVVRSVERDEEVIDARANRDRDRLRDRRMRDRDADVVVDDRRDRDRDRDTRGRRVPPADGREWFRDPGYYGYGNFPTAEVQDAVVANARAATARALFRRAENALNAGVRKAVRTFEGSADLREAQRSEKEAYETYAAARRRALQSVLEDPKYRAIMSLRQELTDQINYKKANRSYDERTDKQVMDDIIAMATLKMNYAADARQMERLALETNSEAKDAQARLRSAAAKVSDMKHDFDDALRNDRDLVAARQNLEDARIARLSATAYLEGAIDAANEALDFAYYLNRYSRYNGAGYQDYRNYYPYSYPYRTVGY
jgi:hypothetical protein